MFAAVGGLVLLMAAAKAVLGVNSPPAVLAGGAIGALVSVAAFTYFVPDEVFPLGRRGSRSAHLDLDARRPAIELALAYQLGVRLLELKPFGLAGSGGSSPMRLLVEGERRPLPLFAKLYARQHVRADRWYKLGRAMLYGRLEDERPFRTVRRMVQSEDYLLRVMRDAGLPVVRSYGFVELTPDREYMLVTEFADGAKEICDDDVTMELTLVDDALRVVRAMWEAGVAHRDVKPSNLLVRDGRLVLIDVAFAEVHPSPWRQAVDLANMMLVLALKLGLRDGLPAGAALLQPGRPGRGLRRHRRGDRAVAVEDVAGERRPRPAGPLPGAGPAAAAGEGAAVEPAPDGAAGRLGGGGRRRHPAGGPGGAVHRSGRGAGRGLPDQHAGAAVRPGGPGRRVRALRSAGVRAGPVHRHHRRCPGAQRPRLDPRRSCPTTAR